MTIVKFFSAIIAIVVLAVEPDVRAESVGIQKTVAQSLEEQALDESVELNNELRSLLGGSFVRLSDGAVAYNIKEVGSSFVAVLIHGYSVPSFVWRGVQTRLNQAGISTLVYDLYGHGLSDRPNTEYTRDLYDRQLTELLHQLIPNKKVLLVGWSMGAMIAARYATKHVDTVVSVYLISPSGLPIDMGATGRIARIPLIGDIGFSLFGGRGLRNAQRQFFEDMRGFEAYMRDFEHQMQFKGFRRAMLSTLREMDMDNFSAEYEKFGKASIPTRVVWAKKDRATPFQNSRVFVRLVPHANVVPMQGVGHASLYENPELVYRLLFGGVKTNQPKNQPTS